MDVVNASRAPRSGIVRATPHRKAVRPPAYVRRTDRHTLAHDRCSAGSPPSAGRFSRVRLASGGQAVHGTRAAEVHPADGGDTASLPETLKTAEAHLAAVDAAPSSEAPAELVADKGYHSCDGLKALDDGAWKSRIAEKKVRDVSRWHGDDDARRAVYNNRARLRSGVAKEAFKLRADLVERSFALTLDRGGMRRAWLRGRENLHKRYLVHVAGYNLGLCGSWPVPAPHGSSWPASRRIWWSSPPPRVPPSSSWPSQPTPKQQYSPSPPRRRHQTDS